MSACPHGIVIAHVSGMTSEDAVAAVLEELIAYLRGFADIGYSLGGKGILDWIWNSRNLKK